MSKPMPRKLECENCGQRSANVLVGEKLNPVNLRPETRRLCSKCRQKLGYQVNRWGRSRPRTPGTEA